MINGIKTKYYIDVYNIYKEKHVNRCIRYISIDGDIKLQAWKVWLVYEENSD